MRADPTRRGLLAGGAGLAATAMLPVGCSEANAFPGTLDGADMVRGHRLRDRGFPAPKEVEETTGILIAGGGIAGLAAGWALAEAGYDDFLLYELEDKAGGNARSGRNPVSAYPLGAHYLPVPNREARALRHMLERFGMIVGHDADGAPRYDPYQLCADLEERLLWRGQWQEGLYPRSGLSAADVAQRDAFFARMQAFRDATGRDGRPAFAIPSAYSSRDAEYRNLDRQSFGAWLRAGGFTSRPLLAHLRYCCRDDYGTEPELVSAWAGIHYFAARRGWAADGDGDRELTWPEGNGHLVARMNERLGGRIRPANTIFGIRTDGDGVLVDRFDHRRERSVRTRARAAIVAMPHFVAARVAPGAVADGGFSYAPWVVANLTVSRPPRGRGTPLAWDNVSASSESLGYVVAAHQTTAAAAGPRVLTWYLPLSRETPAKARKLLLERPLRDWQSMIADDVLAMNPDLAGAIERIDVWRWGHAMIRPTPGFLSDPVRLAAQELVPPIFHAHSDISGLSLFEEAHYRGLVAAESAMRALGHSFTSLL
ncbi:FAD-dependent oxidoreductase [Sphingopyxis sp.]|uniref:FAD-dependent oxidoreductase n=1 Tax=Sphingopyxis sp. TaxID=1908224 RepID=UPI0035B120BE